MNWYKHKTKALNDNLIFEAIQKFGGDGYMVFFGSLEIMADEFDLFNPGSCRVPIKKLSKNFQISVRKLTKILQFFDEKQKNYLWKDKSISSCFDGPFVTLKCNMLADLADEYTEKKIRTLQAKCRDKIPPLSGTEEELEEDKDKRIRLYGEPEGSAPPDQSEILPKKEEQKPPEDLPPTPSIPEAPSEPPCPHQEIVKAYNEKLGDICPKIIPSLWNKTAAEKMLRTRWKEDKARQSIKWWESLFVHIRHNCPFLIGKSDSGWRADLRWIVRPNNFAKILEGKYATDRLPQIGGNGSRKTTGYRDKREVELDLEVQRINDELRRSRSGEDAPHFDPHEEP